MFWKWERDYHNKGGDALRLILNILSMLADIVSIISGILAIIKFVREYNE